MYVSEAMQEMRAAILPPANLENGELGEQSALVARAKLGHAEAFGELYRLNKMKVFRTVLRIVRNPHDAEDVVQKAFHRALVNLQRFREDATFGTWLTRIAINQALMLLRQRRSSEPLFEQGADVNGGEQYAEVRDESLTPEEILSEKERRAILLQAIGKLRKNLQVVVFHRELQGLTTTETARRLGLTVSAVKARSLRARRFIRKHVQRHILGNKRPVKVRVKMVRESYASISLAQAS